MKHYNLLFTTGIAGVLLVICISCSDSVDKIVLTSSGTDVQSSGSSIIIDSHICYGCSQENCFVRCPAQAVSKSTIDNRTVYLIDPEKCIKCGICIKSCPFDAITWKP
jgi:Fe-S-cluster-containing dehydrogenase component